MTGTKKSGRNQGRRNWSPGHRDETCTGLFDFVEGTSTALKEMIGSPSSRKSRFSEERVRLPRMMKHNGAANTSNKNII
ncbi:hypothetical protein L596_024913 [Steinernema carpocapsae]|uniref:Uncharacterized protein n=1 Tax=Steinernema carpocapsae TaxID=34508 RepID=A0A4V6XVR4_STECR|nr:hypothetical protein L596_024913 [Steinernema carpocapsae]